MTNKCPVAHDEAKHDRRTFAGAEQAQELAGAQLDTEIDAVWDEVYEGKHDREIFESSYVDTTLMGRIARIQACGFNRAFATQNTSTDLHDLYLQITDYVKDKAELNLS